MSARPDRRLSGRVSLVSLRSSADSLIASDSKAKIALQTEKTVKEMFEMRAAGCSSADWKPDAGRERTLTYNAGLTVGMPVRTFK